MTNKELTRDEKARLARLEYMKEYRRKHRERAKEWQVTYWAKYYDRTHDQGGEHDDR